MTKCFECRGPKSDEEFVCRRCVRQREQALHFRSAIDKIKGKRDHFDGKGLGNGRVVLTEKERRSLEIQLGVPVSDAQDARRKMKALGMRPVEKGEHADLVDRAAIEWADSGGEARGERPPEILRHNNPFVRPREYKFDHVAEFQRAVAEFKERGGVLTDD